MIYWLVRAFFKAYFFIFHRHRVFGIENIPSGGAVIAPNHISHYDPPVVAISIQEPVFFLARESLFKAPILGRLFPYLNSYPVKGSAKDLASFKLLSKLLHEGKKVCIFPEGARSFDGNLQPFQQGVAMIAIRCNTPIVPTYIGGTFQALSRGRIFPRMWGQTICCFGKPLDPNEYSKKEKKEAQIAITEDLKEAIKALQESYSPTKGQSWK